MPLLSHEVARGNAAGWSQVQPAPLIPRGARCINHLLQSPSGKTSMISKKLLPFLVLGAALSFGALAGGLGCGGKSSSGAVDYSVSAQKNYEKGLKELEDK